MNQPLLLNCDWLGLSVTYGTVEQWQAPPQGYTFVAMDGTNVWRKRMILFSPYAEKVATILYEPKSSIIDSRAALIEIANEWLYHGISVLKIIDLLNDCRPFVINGMSRLDLAVDFNPTESQWQTIQDLSNGKCYVSGKRSGSGFWSLNTNAQLAHRYMNMRIPHCISWGHKTTAVKWKLYYKSKELLDAYGGKSWSKPYIVDCWRDAGLAERDVWRLEVSMHACNQLDYNNGRLTWQAWRECRPQNLYAALYTTRFTVRENQGHADKSNDTERIFLPIYTGGEIRCARARSSQQRNGRITLLRHLVCSLDDHEVLLDEQSREDVLWHIQAIVERNGLEAYFSRMTGENVYEYVENQRIRATDLVFNGYDSLINCDKREQENDTMLYIAQQKWNEN